MSVNLVPKPQSMRISDGFLQLEDNLDIRFEDPTLAFVADQLEQAVTRVGTGQLQQPSTVTAVLQIDIELAAEAYRLQIDEHGIQIVAGSEQGAFYAVQTLRQILFQAQRRDGPIALPLLHIEDAPRLPYRGMHLDVSRHFFDVGFIKRYIDLLALHKMNVFHWHLTDDQGWRIEIEAYPKLTEVGSRRSGTVIGHANDAGAKSDGREYSGYYSQEQVREVLAYAAKRHVTVVPEIDIPGHASAMLAAYPELGCSGEPAHVETHFGIFPSVLCPRESTFKFLEVVFAEVAALFPGPYIHIGGDEVLKDQWQSCQDCSSLMLDQHLEDYVQLQAWFVNRVETIVHALGKRMIGWDEILDGDIRPSATVMSWRGMEGGIRGAKLGHDVIMTPVEHVYFDFYQSESMDEPMAIGGLTRLQDVYRFAPVPPELGADEKMRILGGQGNLWTEYVPDEASAERMVLPRMSALAEVLWTLPEHHSFEDFSGRLPALEQLLRALNYTVADSHYKPHIVASALDNGGFEVALESPVDNMRYTLDGSRPTANAARYREPFEITDTVTIRAASLLPDGRLLGDARMSLLQHKARGCPVNWTSADPPDFSGDESAILVDGRIGHDRIFRYPHWVNFNTQAGMDVTIEFPDLQNVSEVTVGVDAGRHRRLHRPTSFSVSMPDEEGGWKVLAAMDAGTIATSGSALTLHFKEQSVRRLRVVAGNDQPLGSEQKREQLTISLSIDEIIVH